VIPSHDLDGKLAGELQQGLSFHGVLFFRHSPGSPTVLLEPERYAVFGSLPQ
jgi:hypothetical protein